MRVDPQFSELIGLIYQGPLEDPPWQSFLASFREVLNAQLLTLLLRPPRKDQHAVMLADGGSAAAIQNYNEGQFVLDPFVNLPLGEVVTLHEFMTSQALLKSPFYEVVMEPQGWYDFLGADLREKQELDVRLRAGRTRDSRPFGESEKQLVYAILPHLERAIRLHTRLHRTEKERALYAGAVQQLSVGTVILDESGAVMSCNELAETLLAQNDGIGILKGRLHLGVRDKTLELQELIAAVLRAQESSDPMAVEALRVSRPSGLADLGLVIRNVPGPASAQGQSVPSVAIFISDPEQSSEAPVQVITRLFGFTPTEAALAMLLANGLTLDQASAELGVSRNTARTHLRSLFSKTGVSRQTMLVRLILKSVANLA
jgi:DNA-binding CsgD family transcriptional regulator/PAS domain-containing protein